MVRRSAACESVHSYHHQVIIWLNGTVGCGKTSTAAELYPLVPSSRVFDPETVGYMLQPKLADAGDAATAYDAALALTGADVARLAREAGGVAVLAHPFSNGLVGDDLARMVGELAEVGFSGLEALYGRYSPRQRQQRFLVAHGQPRQLAGHRRIEQAQAEVLLGRRAELLQ